MHTEHKGLTKRFSVNEKEGINAIEILSEYSSKQAIPTRNLWNRHIHLNFFKHWGSWDSQIKDVD